MDQATVQALMFSLVEGWKKSGQAQIVFCREKEISYSRFLYWLKKYRDQQQLKEGLPPFAQVNVVPPAAGSVELIYPDGRRPIFHHLVEVSFLLSLLA